MNTPRPKSLPIALALFLCLSFLFLFTQQGLWPNGDPVVMFRVTQSLVDRRSIFPNPDPYVDLVRRSDGRFVSKFGIVQSLVETPFYAAGKFLFRSMPPGQARDRVLFWCAGMASPIVSAMSVAILLLLCVELGLSLSVSCWTALLFGLGGMIWPASKQPFSEPLQTLLILFGFFSLRGGIARKNLILLFSSGLSAGLLPATKSIFLPFIILFLLPVLSPGVQSEEPPRRLRSAIVFLAGCIPGLALTAWYNFARFGSIFSWGYDSGRDALYDFGTPLLSGLYGLLLSPGKSVFIYVPILILSAFGCREMYRRCRSETWYVILFSAGLTLLYSKWWAWHGDWAWGPRFLLPCVALWMPAAGFALEKSAHTGRLAKISAAVLIVFSIYVQILGVSVNLYEYIYITRHQLPYNPLYTPGRAGMSDDMIAQHFIPEFSPVVGHQWLLEGTIVSEVRGVSAGEKFLKEHFPWKMTMPFAPPADPARGLGFDAWWVHLPAEVPETARWARPVAILFAALSALSLVTLSAILLRNKQGKE